MRNKNITKYMLLPFLFIVLFMHVKYKNRSLFLSSRFLMWECNQNLFIMKYYDHKVIYAHLMFCLSNTYIAIFTR